MVRIPSRRAVRMIRRAISPRLATSSEPIMPVGLLWITLWTQADRAVDNSVDKAVESALKCGKCRRAEQLGSARPVHLAAEERGRVHQAEGGVREHPRLTGVEIGAQ